jgi:hypothetical protein
MRAPRPCSTSRLLWTEAVSQTSGRGTTVVMREKTNRMKALSHLASVVRMPLSHALALRPICETASTTSNSEGRCGSHAWFSSQAAAIDGSAETTPFSAKATLWDGWVRTSSGPEAGGRRASRSADSGRATTGNRWGDADTHRSIWSVERPGTVPSVASDRPAAALPLT